MIKKLIIPQQYILVFFSCSLSNSFSLMLQISLIILSLTATENILANNSAQLNQFFLDEGQSLSIKKNPCAQYQQAQMFQWSCAHHERYIPRTPSAEELAEIVLAQANEYYDKDNLPKAEYYYRQALKIQSDFAPAWLALALFYSDLNRDADALQILQSSLEHIQDNADIHFETGLLQVRLRQLSKAVASLAKAAILAPDNPHYSYVYGIAMNSYHQPEKALDILHKAYLLHPDNKEILIALVSINQDMNNNLNALKYAEKLQQLDPEDVSIQNFITQLQSELEPLNTQKSLKNTHKK